MKADKQCSKMSFYNQAEATKYIQFITRQVKRNRKGLKRLRAYKCWQCEEWHLTSQSKHYANVVKRKRRESKKPSDD